ncbi:hypothetical protein BYT27DRAFT_6922620 [Phlegmacium glaucopus]|nr:hypothetical protein BYT27DRAFT_6922620 [Phlegmacium glaucopus]
MCYLGVGDTFTPCHKDLCASSGQNLMCHTENGGSSFWFMTETGSATEVAKFFHSLGRELDHENYVVTLEELSKARFKVYILEQKLGDLVLVPPRSAHQVVNFGGITVKTSWSRMSLKGLVQAYHQELPIYRRVCRPETYRVKSTTHHALLGLTMELRSLLQHTDAPNSSDNDKGKQQESLPSNIIQKLLVLYDHILAEEFETHREEMPRSSVNEGNSIEDEHILCDFCGGDIFQSFFECRTCVEADSAEGGYVVCPGCYAEGRSCKCHIMQRMQRQQFKILLDTRKEAIQVVDMYERRHGRSFKPSDDYCDINNHNYPRIFSAACVLLDIRMKKSGTRKVCTRSESHNVPFPWALTCKMCHHAKCFCHILAECRIHSVEALLLHNIDDSHQKYHNNHITGRKTKSDIGATDVTNIRLGHQQLAYYATSFTHCKPIKPQFMNLGWYDETAHISDDQESPSQAEMRSMLILDTTVSVSTECGPVVVQPPTSTTANSVKGKRKGKPYVLVPPAPYRIPSQGSDSQRRSQQAASSTSAPLSTQHGPEDMLDRPGRRVPSLQEKLNAPKALTTFEPSTQTLSDIGISVPTTVRRSGSFIIHTRDVVPRDRTPAEGVSATERPVEPVKSHTTRASKPPHVANPVTGRIITRGSLSNLKFNKSNKSNKSKATHSKPPPSSSNDSDATAVTSTNTQEGFKSTLPDPQLVPPPLSPSEIASVFPVKLAASFAEAVMHQVGYLLCQKTPNPGQPMNPFDTSSNSNGSPQTSNNQSQYYSPPQPYNGPPQQYNGPPQQYNDSPQHYNGLPQQCNGPPQQCNDPPQHYNGLPQHYNGPPQQYNDPPQLYNGPPRHYNAPPRQYNDLLQHQQYSGLSQRYNDPPHYSNGPPRQYSSHMQYPHVHPQSHKNQSPYPAASYPPANQPQFHQDGRRPPHNRAAARFVGKTGYVNHQPRYEYNAHRSGRNKMPVQSTGSKPPHKKRKYNGPQDPQSQTRLPNNSHSYHDARPPRGPRGYKKTARNHSTSGRINYQDGIERSTSGDHERLSWGTSGSGTPSTDFQSQSAPGSGGYHHPFNPGSNQFDLPNHGLDSFIEPKREGSAPRRCINNRRSDTTMDITDVDSNVIQPPLSMADPMLPDPQIPQDRLYPDDLVLDIGDTPHEAGAPMDDLPNPIVEDQGNDQNWEDGYEIPEERASQALVPESGSRSAPSAGGSLDSIFNVADDDMADVTDNPWTS